MGGPLKKKSYDFAIKIVKLYQEIIDNNKEYVMSKQVLEAGTSIGELVSESEYAQSKPDFINKLSIALKEANETQYWLSILKDTKHINEETYERMNLEVSEIIRLLISSIKTTKKGIGKK